MTDAANVTKNLSRSDAGFTNLTHKNQATIKTADKNIFHLNSQSLLLFWANRRWVPLI